MNPGVASAAQQQTSKPSGSLLVHAGFVLTGMVTTLLGPILPALSARWSLLDRQAGYLFTAQFLGSILGSTLTRRLLPAWGFRLSLVSGLVLMAGGVGALAAGPWMLGMTAVFCYGVGLGIVIPAANLLVAENSGDRSASTLNVLNFCWSAGAVACPLAVMLADGAGETRVFLLALALLLVLTAMQVRLSLPGHSSAATAEPGAAGRLRGMNVAVLAALFFLYIGTENSLAGWVATYAQRAGAAWGRWWALTPSLFWGALLTGRALAPLILRRTSSKTLANAGLILSTGAIASLIWFAGPRSLLFGIAVAGLGFASIFPLTIARAAQTLGGSASRIAGPLFACGALGGASLPWLVGWLSTRSGSLRTGFVVALLGSAGMLVLNLTLSKPTNKIGFHSDKGFHSDN